MDAVKRAAAALLSAILAGAPVHAEPYLNFACADGSKISLIFEKSGTGLVMVDGGALRLQNRRPASGIWYASPYGDFRVRGDRAAFRMQGRKPTICARY